MSAAEFVFKPDEPMQLELGLPDEVIGGVLFVHLPDGGLGAMYVEGQERVPADREQMAHSLMRIAAQLLADSIALDEAEAGS